MTGGEACGVVEQMAWRGRTCTVTWLPSPFQPPRALTTQAYGICFVEDGRIVLVSSDAARWNLPGGHPEGEETLEEALAREVREEACAAVTTCSYIGCQRVDDPERADGATLYYQARFWARVGLDPFAPRFERTHRRLVAPAEFLDLLEWGRASTARIILQAGLALEQRHGRVA